MGYLSTDSRVCEEIDGMIVGRTQGVTLVISESSREVSSNKETGKI